MLQRQSRRATTLATLGLDLVLAAAMLTLFSFSLTGLQLHEWLGLGLGILIPTRMLVNGGWLASTTRLLLGSLPCHCPCGACPSAWRSSCSSASSSQAPVTAFRSHLAARRS